MLFKLDISAIEFKLKMEWKNYVKLWGTSVYLAGKRLGSYY